MAQAVQNPPARQETWVGKIPWRKEWKLTPASFPGESHEHRSQAGYSPWDCKESDFTEQLTLCLPIKIRRLFSNVDSVLIRLHILSKKKKLQP